MAFPTETVYGLGANAFSDSAICKIFDAKGRASDNPLIVHISKKSQLHVVAVDMPDIAWSYIESFWPGPLTLILKKHNNLALAGLAGLDTVGVRLPNHPVATKLIDMCGPLVAPSANLSGSPSPTTAQHVLDDLSGKIDAIIDGGDTSFGLESTVLDTATGRILRPGAITQQQLSTISKVVVDTTFGQKNIDKPIAPGQKYTHYAPKAKTALVMGTDIPKKILNLATTKKNIGILTTDQNIQWYKSLQATVLSLGDKNNPQGMATLLYKHLRQFDKVGIDFLYIEGFSENHGFYLTLMDRLVKASSYNII